MDVTRVSLGTGLGSAFRLAAAAAVLCFGAPALAINFDESSVGDYSSLPGSPTSIGTLSYGANEITGASTPSGKVVGDHGELFTQDPDYFTFTVAPGQILSHIYLDTGSVIGAGDRFFIGIVKGASVNVPSGTLPASGLLGWTLGGSGDVGTDLLPGLGLSAPANFDSVPGATGFSGPLPAGTYSIWIEDAEATATYRLDLVTSVPEPAAWGMMTLGIGLAGATLRRRRSGNRERRVLA